MIDAWYVSALSRRPHAFAPDAVRSRCGWMRIEEYRAPAGAPVRPRCVKCAVASGAARRDELQVTDEHTDEYAEEES